MLNESYRFVIEFRDESGRLLGEEPVDIDWGPAIEAARFEVLRQRHLDALPLGPVQVEPVWSDAAGEPGVSGIRAFVGDDPARSIRFSSRYFRAAAEKASGRLIAAGQLREGETFRYSVFAFRIDSPATARSRIQFDEVAQVLPLHRSGLDEWMQSAVTIGVHDPADIPVFVEQSVLDEITELTERAGPVETGGLLLAEFHRDLERPEVLFVHLAAQVAAQHAVAQSMKLSFTPETWAAYEAMLRLRQMKDVMGGWWHSHIPKYWCQECPAERRQVCPLQDPAGFFSDDDRAVHRTVAPQVWTVGLLANYTDAGVGFAAFGWREGQVVRRGFYVTNVTHPVRVAAETGATAQEDLYAPCRK